MGKYYPWTPEVQNTSKDSSEAGWRYEYAQKVDTGPKISLTPSQQMQQRAASVLSSPKTTLFQQD